MADAFLSSHFSHQEVLITKVAYHYIGCQRFVSQYVHDTRCIGCRLGRDQLHLLRVIIFYVALPGPTVDWTLDDGVAGVPIEQRDGREVSEVTGRTADGRIETVRITPDGSPTVNYAFDVTPAKLVTALITERGVCPASRAGLAGLYPELASAS